MNHPKIVFLEKLDQSCHILRGKKFEMAGLRTIGFSTLPKYSQIPKIFYFPL